MGSSAGGLLLLARLRRIVVAGSIVLLAAAPVAAMVPPLQQVQQWAEMDGYNRSVHFAAYDPSDMQWHRGAVGFPGTPGRYCDLFSIAAQGGIVTWWAYEMSGGAVAAREVWYAVYDPARGVWRNSHKRYETTSGYEWSISSLRTDGGVVAWTAESISVSDSGARASASIEICYSTYDALKGAWQDGSRSASYSVASRTATFVMGDGMVAWAAYPMATSGQEIGYAIYDPVRGAWQQGQTVNSWSYGSGLTIADQTVKWSNGTKGYDPSKGAWYSGPTKPLACFYATPTESAKPTSVWFLDMSIGGATCSWAFGDGEESTDRGVKHSYGYGSFTASQTVIGAGGTNTASQTIKIGLMRACVSQKPGSVHDGMSWDTAFGTVQEGVTATLPGGETWVAAGTYVENVTVTPGIGLYGGFAGDETEREQRDWTRNVTILDGSKRGSVVVLPSSAEVSTVIDGFTVRNGSALHGGGIYCSGSGSVISGNTIRGNSACDGAGIYFSANEVLISGNTISGNDASGSGGGIYGTGGISNSAASRVEHNLISGNRAASDGGGVAFRSCLSAIVNNVIANNAATSESAYGGGVSLYDSYPNVVSNTVVRNTAANAGGFYVSGNRGPAVWNNIVAFCSAGISSTSPGTYYSNCVYGCGSGTVPSGTITNDPRLADAEHGDYHLTPVSPCIDRGDSAAPSMSATDIDGDPRALLGKVDIGADEYSGPPAKIADAKLLANGSAAYVGGIVTSVSTSDFTIESDDRLSGLMVVKSNSGLAVGDRVAVVGTLSVGMPIVERRVTPTQIIRSGTGTIMPIAMSNTALGGVDWNYNSVTGAGQSGVTGGVGANNVGLLVTICGRVTYVSGYFVYIDDGAGLLGHLGTVGVWVYTTSGRPPLSVGDYVMATGISSGFRVFATGAYRVYRMMRVTSPLGVVVLH